MHKITDGLNKLIHKLAQQGSNDIITVAYFSDEIHFLTKMTNIKYVNYFDLKQFIHFGCTALYNSVFTILTDKDFNTNLETYFYILSDGEDNASTITKDEIDILCNQARKSGLWNVIFFHPNNITDMKETYNVVYDLNDDLSNLFSDMTV
jgi:hypothetical protein